MKFGLPCQFPSPGCLSGQEIWVTGLAQTSALFLEIAQKKSKWRVESRGHRVTAPGKPAPVCVAGRHAEEAPSPHVIQLDLPVYILLFSLLAQKDGKVGKE